MNAPARFDPLDTVRALLACPTAPFHEDRVMAVIRSTLDGLGIPYGDDRHGNLIARHGRARTAPWALMAHADHPGVEITSVQGNVCFGTFLGGVRPDSLPGARLRLAGTDGRETTGTILDTRKVNGEKRVRIHPDGQVRKGQFGGFDLGPPAVDQQRIRGTAVDDLVGCATILGVLANLKHSGAPCRVLGVFTRAEEVGFAGAQALVTDRSLPDDALVVSLEASMELPGARQGKGPVIRVGDRTSVYDSALERHLHVTAQKLEKSEPGFRFQRQLMSGGTCEATVFTAAGYRAAGLAYPLLNYHNMAEPEGIASEEVATPDYLNGITLLTRAVSGKGRPAEAFARYQAALSRSTGRYVDRLTRS